jgi:serine/threonine protein kinase
VTAGTWSAVWKKAPTVSTSELPTARGTRAGYDRAPPPAGEAPLVLDRYRLHKRLGQGGFGTVWAAHDERLERDVAVKILPRERIVGGRFEREARAAARLSHHAIVTLYEAAVDDEGAYLVSELIRGGTLTKALDAGRLSDREIVLLGMTLCEALAHAHGEGVIHRDVKPSNILLPALSRKSGRGNAVVKLTDFGVAHLVGGDSLTRTGDILGTAAYMAPEQAEGLAVGPEADLYALALVLYEALTGINPVRTTTSASRARRLGAHLPPLRRQRRELPRELGAGIDLALRPRPIERGTVEELHAALGASYEQVSQQRGVVAEPARPVGVTLGTIAVKAARRGEKSRDEAEEDELWAPSRREPQPRPEPPELEFEGPTGVTRPMRALTAVGGAAIAWWPASLGLTPVAIPVAAYALIGGLVTIVAPLTGYVGLTMFLGATVAASGHAGAAIVLLGLLALPIALLPGRGSTWSLPAGAVGLGAIGLAGAWPALAGRIGGSLCRRAALGACAMPWLAGAGELAGRSFYVRLSPHAPAPVVWTSSPRVAIDQVVGAIADPQVLAAALVWAVAAAVLPWVSNGRRAVSVEFVAVAVWSAVTVSATVAALDLGGHHRSPAGTAVVLGGVISAIICLWPVLRRVRREAALSGRAEPGLP